MFDFAICFRADGAIGRKSCSVMAEAVRMLCKIVTLLWRCVGWLFWNPIQVVVSNRTDFFNYRRLLKLRFFGNPIMLQENSWYGHLSAVRNFGGTGFGSRIEHGVFFAENVTSDMEGVFTPLSIKVFHLKRVYTFSQRRRKIILRFLEERGLKMEVVSLGPYVLLAKHFLSGKKLVELKEELGRVLLVYPQHSTETVICKYDTRIILDQIERMRQAYDTVLVSLYWVDVLRGKAEAYEAAGCKVVCAGRREDPNSISRQKDLLTLADRVLSNTVGTYVGYAIAMGKPCTLFRQDVETSVGNEEELQNHNGSKVAMNCFYPVFAADVGEITDEQRNLVKEFWGEA